MKLKEYPIPNNYMDADKLFGGRIKKRNCIEGAIFTAPVIALFVFLVKFERVTSMAGLAILVVCTVATFMIAVSGYKGDSWTELINSISAFQKARRIAKYNPRVKTEARPDYLYSNGQMLPRDKLMLMASGVSEKMFGDDESPINEDITDENVVPWFRDDEGFVEKPDDIKTKAELKADAKKRKKLAKEKEKAAIAKWKENCKIAKAQGKPRPPKPQFGQKSSSKASKDKNTTVVKRKSEDTLKRKNQGSESTQKSKNKNVQFKAIITEPKKEASVSNEELNEALAKNIDVLAEEEIFSTISNEPEKAVNSDVEVEIVNMDTFIQEREAELARQEKIASSDSDDGRILIRDVEEHEEKEVKADEIKNQTQEEVEVATEPKPVEFIDGTEEDEQFAGFGIAAFREAQKHDIE